MSGVYVGELDTTSVWEGFFSAFRHKPFPPNYPSQKTAVAADILEAGFIFAGIIIALSFLVLLPGFRGLDQKIQTLSKIAIGVFITLVIFLCNFGQEWEVARIHTKTAYRAGSRHEINATIGIKIGLRSVNITLKGTPEHQQLESHIKEHINYNERFDWSTDNWQQGLIGFGPYASSVNQDFRRAQFHGTPYPILWIAEYFTIDGEGIRWGRFYRQAGFYAHTLLWLAFPMWILSLILFQSVIFYGVIFCLITGACHIVAVCLFASIRNPTVLKIPFEDETLHLHWGWTFYLCLFNGVLCVILAITVFIIDIKNPDVVSRFFGTDSINDFEEFYLSANELKEMGIQLDPGTPSTAPSTPVDFRGEDMPDGSSLPPDSRSDTPLYAYGVDETEDESDTPEIIQVFRRKPRGGNSLAGIVHKHYGGRPPSRGLPTYRMSTQLFNGIHTNNGSPSPPSYSDIRPNNNSEGAYENVEISSNQNSISKVSKVMWKVLPEGETIKIKPLKHVRRHSRNNPQTSIDVHRSRVNGVRAKIKGAKSKIRKNNNTENG